MQIIILLSSARILWKDLETWGNLLLLKPCKLQYYWAQPEYWKGFWRFEETCCYRSHTNYSIIEFGQNTEKSHGDLRNMLLVNQANYSIIELGQNTEKGFGDMRKLVVTEAMQTTVLLSSARILRRILETGGNLWLLKSCKLQYYWPRQEYWEGFWRFVETFCYWSHEITVLLSTARILKKGCYWRHANYSIIELGRNTEKAFRDLRKIVATEDMKQQYYWDVRKLVVTEAIQTTVLLILARILKNVLETWRNLLLLKQYK